MLTTSKDARKKTVEHFIFIRAIADDPLVSDSFVVLMTTSTMTYIRERLCCAKEKIAAKQSPIDRSYSF